MDPRFAIPAPLAALDWHRASHSAGFGVWHAEISHQRASFLLNRYGWSWSVMARDGRALHLALPKLGWQTELTRLSNGSPRFWISNRAGQYSVEAILVRIGKA
jgi:hypothetical protein